jgi:hypothetical protein
MKPPQEALPPYSEASEYFGETWVRYPGGKIPLPSAYGETVRATCELRSIINTIALQSSNREAPSDKITWEEACAYRAMLQSWYHNLPQSISARCLIFPAHLKLQ